VSRGWTYYSAGELADLLDAVPRDTDVRVRVDFPDIGHSVEDWNYRVTRNACGVYIETAVYGREFGRPDVIKRIKKIVDVAMETSFLS
jgi:hypothetical protein